MTSVERYSRIAELCIHNAQSLLSAVEYCAYSGIGAFRVNSRILPLKTHPELGYRTDRLPDAAHIRNLFELCGKRARDAAIRFSFHPDQFVLLSSHKRDVTRRSVLELEYQAEVSTWIGADAINIHGGGAYGNKASALHRLEQALTGLGSEVRERLTLENDDRTYTPADLLPFCEANAVPFVYDVHHHRCLKDGLSIESVTERALKTWNREPLFHVSSPKTGWDGPNPCPHHDYVDINDIPHCWKGLDITVDIEAKAKERAVKRLLKQIHETWR